MTPLPHSTPVFISVLAANSKHENVSHSFSVFESETSCNCQEQYQWSQVCVCVWISFELTDMWHRFLNKIIMWKLWVVCALYGAVLPLNQGKNINWYFLSKSSQKLCLKHILMLCLNYKDRSNTMTSKYREIWRWLTKISWEIYDLRKLKFIEMSVIEIIINRSN